MTSRRVRWLAGLAGAAALSAAAHTALWLWATRTLESHVAATLAAGPLPGWQAAGGVLRRDGWPLRATVHVPDPVLQAPLGGSADAQGIRWTAEHLSVSVSLLRPRVVVLAVIGRQGLQLGLAPPIPVNAQTMRAELPLQPGVPARSIAIEVADLQADLPEGRIGMRRLDVWGQARPAAQQGEPALAVNLLAQGIALPPVRNWPLGPAIARLAADAVLTGPVPLAADLLQRAEGWRDGGGVLELHRLELEWGEARLSGSATLALDAQVQPMGAATARLTGHAAALDALQSAGVVTPRGAVAAKAVLGLMSRPALQDGRPTVEVPFSLQDRTLALGRIPLVRLPELVWRSPH